MPYTAPTVGYVTRSGYVYCTRCATDEHRTTAEPIAGDTCGTAEEPCDACGSHLYTEPIRCAGYVHIPYFGAPAPEIRPDNPYWPH